VATALELHAGMARGAALVVLAPGTYKLASPLPGPHARRTGARWSLLGLGGVTLRCRTSHAVWLERGEATLANMRLVGSGELAAACVAPPPGCDALLRLANCCVENYPGGGLLLHGGRAMEGCSFLRCGRTAVEVRQGGSLAASGLRVEECWQGVACREFGAGCLQAAGWWVIMSMAIASRSSVISIVTQD
jgi:hypothetical protein